MVLGFFYGAQEGIRISKLSSDGKYHTPVRQLKKEYAFLTNVDID